MMPIKKETTDSIQRFDEMNWSDFLEYISSLIVSKLNYFPPDMKYPTCSSFSSSSFTKERQYCFHFVLSFHSGQNSGYPAHDNDCESYIYVWHDAI